MAIEEIYVVAHFVDNGVPKTGLSPVITVWQVDTSTKLIDSQPMSEIGDGGYKYYFTTYDTDKDYLFVSDGGAILESSDRYKYTTNETGIVSAAVEAIDVASVSEIVEGILDEPLVDHRTNGTVGNSLNYSNDWVSGNYHIDTTLNELHLYREGDEIGVDTPFLKFDLKDISGNPASQGVFRREKQ